MTDTVRPSGGASSELRRTIWPWSTDIPLLSADPFNLDARLVIGGQEFVRCTGRSGYTLTGCVRGVSPEDGGSGAKTWPGGTSVDQMPWTTTEVVTSLPTAAVADIGRQISYNGILYEGQLDGAGTPYWHPYSDATFDAGTLVIAGDAVTLPRIPPNTAIIYLQVDTEGGAASDDLNAVVPTGSLETGTLLVLSTVNINRDVSVRALAPTTGNIGAGGAFELTSTIRRLTLMWQQSSLTWGPHSRSNEALSRLDDVFLAPASPPVAGDYLGHDGSNWVNKKVGLTLVVSSPFSAVASVSLDNRFTSTYETYLIVVSNMSSSAAADWQLRLRAAGTDDAAGNHYLLARNQTTAAGANAPAGSGAGGNQWSPINPSAAVTDGMLEVLVARPFLADGTSMRFIGGIVDSSFRSTVGAGAHTQATSYDGFTLLPASGTISGTVRVYGVAQ